MSNFWSALSAAANWLKDKYLAVVDWVDDNPQKTIWLAFALILAGLFV